MNETPKQPKTFGEKFKDDGLLGIIKKKQRKNNPNEMHFLQHLEELRWVIFKAILAFSCRVHRVAILCKTRLNFYKCRLVSAVEDFGVIDIDLQTIGLNNTLSYLMKKKLIWACYEMRERII